MVVSVLYVEQTRLIKSKMSLRWQHLTCYLDPSNHDLRQHFTKVKRVPFMLRVKPHFKHQNVHFKWLPWQQKIVSHQTYFIQYTIFIGMCLGRNMYTEVSIINVFLTFVAIFPMLPWLFQ